MGGMENWGNSFLLILPFLRNKIISNRETCTQQSLCFFPLFGGLLLLASLRKVEVYRLKKEEVKKEGGEREREGKGKKPSVKRG